MDVYAKSEPLTPPFKSRWSLLRVFCELRAKSSNPGTTEDSYTPRKTRLLYIHEIYLTLGLVVSGTRDS